MFMANEFGLCLIGNRKESFEKTVMMWEWIGEERS